MVEWQDHSPVNSESHVVVTLINLAICWKIRESDGTRESKNPFGAGNQQERREVENQRLESSETVRQT
jgi:hypothetical protein